MTGNMKQEIQKSMLLFMAFRCCRNNFVVAISMIPTIREKKKACTTSNEFIVVNLTKKYVQVGTTHTCTTKCMVIVRVVYLCTNGYMHKVQRTTVECWNVETVGSSCKFSEKNIRFSWRVITTRLKAGLQNYECVSLTRA